MSLNILDLSGRKYIVTGAASGIGRASAILLSTLGAELVLFDIDEKGLIETIVSCESRVNYRIIDLTDSDAVKSTIAEVCSTYGKIHGFAHIAGRPYIAPLKAVNDKTSKDVFSLNTYAAVDIAKNCILKNNYAGKHGSFVFISSIYGIVGSAANVGYAMSKAGLIGATKALSMELAPKGIRVNCVAPGFIKTEMFEGISGSFDESYINKVCGLHPLGLGEANDIAYAIAYLFSDMSKWVTGSVLNVDGGYTAQ